MSLKGFPINEFKYQLIKLKDYKAEDFEKKITILYLVNKLRYKNSS